MISTSKLHVGLLGPILLSLHEKHSIERKINKQERDFLTLMVFPDFQNSCHTIISGDNIKPFRISSVYDHMLGLVRIIISI
jgi:hypothetical protein